MIIPYLILLLALLSPSALVQADNDDNDVDSMSLEEVMEMMKPISEECHPQPTEDQMKEIILNKEDAQQGTKCFRHCLMKKFNVLEEGQTKMNVTQTVEMINYLVPDKETEVKEIIEKCNEENANIEDFCELAHKHGMCILRLAKERKFEMPQVKE